MATLRKDGDVLVPVDTCSRCLELAYILENHWREQRLASYQVILLNTASQKVVDYAKSTIEWMGDAVKSYFESTRENPFDFK